MPALSNTLDSRSNKAALPPNARRAAAFASACETRWLGTTVASESKVQGCIQRLYTGELARTAHNDPSIHSSRRVDDGCRLWLGAFVDRCADDRRAAVHGHRGGSLFHSLGDGFPA